VSTRSTPTFRNMRLWLDELSALPEYSTSLPTGACQHKCWKRKHDGEWIVGCYDRPLMYGAFPVVWFRVVLLQGPRQPGTRSRLRTSCC